MASDRMMQAIGTLERAISRLEQVAAALPPVIGHVVIGHSVTGPSDDPVDTAAARAALRSLDALIGELKGTPHG